jgi:hypothetical protein
MKKWQNIFRKQLRQRIDLNQWNDCFGSKDGVIGRPAGGAASKTTPT